MRVGKGRVVLSVSARNIVDRPGQRSLYLECHFLAGKRALSDGYSSGFGRLGAIRDAASSLLPVAFEVDL